MGDYGVKLSDTRSDGTLTKILEENTRDAFKRNAGRLVSDLLARSDVAARCENGSVPTATPTPGVDDFYHDGNGLLWSYVAGAENFLGNEGYVANPQAYLVTTDLLETEDDIRGKTTEVFFGEIYDADGDISFYENIDDSVRLYINDQLVLSNDSWENSSQTTNLNIAPGWNKFELRLGNDDGDRQQFVIAAVGGDNVGDGGAL